jgi:hypothetical protein
MVLSAALILTAAWQPAARADDEGAALVGAWQADVDGFQEVVTISMDQGVWSVRGAYYKDGAEVGSFQGDKVHLTAGGSLEFHQDYDKVPAGVGWRNGASVIIRKAKGGNLSYAWRTRKAHGTRTLTPKA